MHEMALCENLLNILREQANRQSFLQVKRIRLEVGPASCVEPEALRFCFQAISQNTLAQDAELQIIAKPAQAWCMDCEQNVTVHARFDPCPRCGNEYLHLQQADDLRIKDLEVI